MSTHTCHPDESDCSLDDMDHSHGYMDRSPDDGDRCCGQNSSGEESVVIVDDCSESPLPPLPIRHRDDVDHSHDDSDRCQDYISPVEESIVIVDDLSDDLEQAYGIELSTSLEAGSNSTGGRMEQDSSELESTSSESEPTFVESEMTSLESELTSSESESDPGEVVGGADSDYDSDFASCREYRQHRKREGGCEEAWPQVKRIRAARRRSSKTILSRGARQRRAMWEWQRRRGKRERWRRNRKLRRRGLGAGGRVRPHTPPPGNRGTLRGGRQARSREPLK